MPATTTTRVVTSPAGERVEIVPDTEWAELTGAPLQGVQRVMSSKVALLRTLWNEGTVRSDGGQATEALRRAAGRYGYTGHTTMALTAMFNERSSVPAVHRDINGRRTMSIRLMALPETWHARIVAADAADKRSRPRPDTPQPAATPPPATDPTPEPSTETTPVDVATAERVAMSLLTQLVDMLAKGGQPDPQLGALTAQLGASQERIASLLSDNESLRNRLRDVGEELHATKTERDGLRKRLAMAEHNVAAVLNGPSRSIVAEAINREVAKVMSAPPAGSKGLDDA